MSTHSEKQKARYAASPEVRARITQNSKDWRRDNPHQYLLTNARKYDRASGRECLIDLVEVRYLFAGMTCAFSGLPLRFSEEVRDPLGPSIDRIDNALGHVPGNVRPTAWVINRMRGALSDEEFLSYVRAIAQHSLGMIDGPV